MSILADLADMELGPSLIGEQAQFSNLPNLVQSGAEAGANTQLASQEPGFRSMIAGPGSML